MATDFFRFNGIAQWAKVWKHQVDRKYKTLDGAGKFSIQVKVEDEAELKRSGLRLKKNDDGYYTFSRPEFRIFNGEKKEFGPPEVVGVPAETLVGNGSRVSINVAVYDTQVGKGHRLNEVEVIELVKYERPVGNDKPPVD